MNQNKQLKIKMFPFNLFKKKQKSEEARLEELSRYIITLPGATDLSRTECHDMIREVAQVYNTHTLSIFDKQMEPLLHLHCTFKHTERTNKLKDEEDVRKKIETEELVKRAYIHLEKFKPYFTVIGEFKSHIDIYPSCLLLHASSGLLYDFEYNVDGNNVDVCSITQVNKKTRAFAV